MTRSAHGLWIALFVLAGGLAAGALFLAPRLAPAERVEAGRTLVAGEDPSLGPGLQPVDVFHPDRRPKADGSLPDLPEPAYGGRVAVQIEATPKHLCATVENSSVTRRILYEVHETLLLRDWETAEWKPDLALSYDVEDRLVQKSGATAVRLLSGSVRDDGDDWVVERRSRAGKVEIGRVRKKEDVELQRGTVLTFHLRPDVRWHDGHPFDARDVAFSCELYRNEFVDCGEKRQRFLKIENIQASVAAGIVQFTLERPYFNALETIGDMCILPAHLYDLADPNNADGNRMRAARPDWTPSAEEQGRYVNENPRNREWVGLGPYRVASFTADGIEAVRFDGYFDPENAGYVDVIRWRAIPDDVAFQAAINGELDFFPRMSTDDYFGGSVQASSFTQRLYKGYFYTPDFWYVGWNLDHPQLSDVRVRRALAMLFDFEQFRRTFYKGLAVQVTGPFSVYSPAYDRDLKPLPCDPRKAAALLDEAGWKDGDGDGVRDKEGTPLRIEVLLLPNNRAGSVLLSKFQEDLARAGIDLRLVPLEWATLEERRLSRDYDAVARGWSPPIETDPEQLWHSRWGGKGVRSSNSSGFRDERADELIERGQCELDPEKRRAIWRELHRRIYELQPYLFLYNPARKFAMNKAIRGFQCVPVTPNYVIRRWYYPEGTPGTRASLVPPSAPGGARKDG